MKISKLLNRCWQILLVCHHYIKQLIKKPTSAPSSSTPCLQGEDTAPEARPDGSIMAFATITNKPENQDSAGLYPGSNFNAAFIADGMGNALEPKCASNAVIQSFAKSFEALDKAGTPANFAELFEAAKRDIMLLPNHQVDNAYATTAMVVVETGSQLSVAYAGNGGAWHIRGNVNDFPGPYILPWNIANYLNPHTVPERGKEALYRLISNTESDTEYIPSVITFEKDRVYGDIVMLCTDGIYSADQLRTGRNDTGTWVRQEENMLLFSNRLKRYLSQQSVYTARNLQEMLDAYLIEAKPSLDDDATIAVLITQEAIQYHQSVKQRQADANH